MVLVLAGYSASGISLGNINLWTEDHVTVLVGNKLHGDDDLVASSSKAVICVSKYSLQFKVLV